MYRIYNRESGWLIFQEKSLAALIGRLFSYNGGLPQPHDFSEWRSTDPMLTTWLQASSCRCPMHKSESASSISSEQQRRRPRRINQNNTSYYCALLCLVSRSRETREALSVEIVTYELGDAHTKTRYVNAQEFYNAFQKRLFALIREEKELSGEQPTPA